MPTTNPYPLNPNPSLAALPYNPNLSLWLSVDPLSDKYPGVSPYVYCANNPVRLVDVDGRDWVEREYEGKSEVYYDRSVKSQADIDKKYGEKSGIRYLADGSKVGNGQYTVYNDHKYNKYGVVKDASGSTLKNHRNIVYGSGFIIFAGVTDESLNAETLHKNLMGTSYTGGNNPKSYNNQDNYNYIPSNLSELFSIVHDKQYDDLGAVGIKGPLLQTNTWKADFLFATSNLVSIPFNRNYIDKTRSAATAAAFYFIGTYKMVADSAKKTWHYAKKSME